MGYALVCPSCKGRFKWNPVEGMPEHCKLCGAFVGHTDKTDTPCFPFIKSAKTKANDDLYRQIEKGSEARMEQAAQMAGCAPDDMSSLKITNMQETPRQGDIAAIPVTNDVTRQMDMMQQRGMPVGYGVGANGVGYSENVQAGAFANAGAKFQSTLREHHAKLSNWQAVGDRPALETQQPGYRRRA